MFIKTEELLPCQLGDVIASAVLSDGIEGRQQKERVLTGEDVS